MIQATLTLTEKTAKNIVDKLGAVTDIVASVDRRAVQLEMEQQWKGEP